MTPLERLTEAVIATEFSVRRIEQCFNQFNNPFWPELLAQPLSLAKEYLAINRSMPTPSVAEDYVDLAGILGEIEWPPTGADPDQDARLFDLQDRVGRLVIDCLTIVAAARNMGIGYAQPTSIHPDGLQVPRTGHAATLAAIAGHVDDLEFQLNQLADSRNDNAATPRQRAIVASYRQVVTSNIHKIRAAIQTGSTIALEVLDRTGGALVTATRQFVATIRAGASRATPALRTAAKAVSKPVQGMVRSFGAIVKRILGESGNPAPPPPPLPDDFVEQAHAMILAGTVPPAHWVPDLTTLDFSVEPLTDLDPLAGLIALQRLDLMGTRINDLAPLAGLTALQRLVLWKTQVSDLTPLARLTALQHLDLMHTETSDLTPLVRLTALQHLDLIGTQVSDLTPLAGLTMLQHLMLNRTQISDLTPLTGLEMLEGLDLVGTQVSDFAPLARLTGLQSLNLRDTQISDLAPLARLTGLQLLNLSGTQISDCTLLAGFTALHILDLSGTQISDFTLLAGLTALQRLHLNDTQVSNLAPLAGFTALQNLYLRGTQVSDLAPLAGLTALQRLNLSGTLVSDLAAVSDKSDLTVRVKDDAHAAALRMTLLEGSKVRVIVPAVENEHLWEFKRPAF